MEDIQESLKNLLGSSIDNMLKSEMDEHLGYEEYEEVLMKTQEME